MPGEERRICADDGIAYSKQEFLDYFGDGLGMQKWITAPAAVPPATWTMAPASTLPATTPVSPSNAVSSSLTMPSRGSFPKPKWAPAPNTKLSVDSDGRGAVRLTTTRKPVVLEKARFGVAVNPIAPKDTHLKNAVLSAKQQLWLRKYWVLVSLSALALVGLILAIILFALPCDPIFTPFEVVTIVNRTNFTNTTVNQTQLVNTTVNSTNFSAAPFDGMILIDESGSITNPVFCGQNCKFEDEVNLSIIVAQSLYDGVATKAKNNGVEDVHFTFGALTWNNDVSDTKKFYPTPNITLATEKMEQFKQNVGTGGTEFAPPLATCASYVTTWTETSNDPGAFKMCMLLSDGENNDADPCTEADCVNLCNAHGISLADCSVENIVWLIKTKTNITIPAAFLAISESTRNEGANNIYCYSSCNADYKNIGTCKAQLFGAGNATADAETRAKCRFFIDGEFDANGQNVELERKLVELANSITSEVTVQSVQSSAVSVESVQSSAVIVQANVSSESSVQTGVKEEGCQDPGYFWLLLFFLPLLVYLLYFPCKRRRDKWKEAIREKLMAQREAMHEDRVARMEKAQAIRERLEAAQAEQAAKQKKVQEAEKAVAAATEAANTAAIEKAQKEALQADVVKKKVAADEKVAQKEQEIEELKPKAEPKPKPKPKPKVLPPEPGEKKKFKWNITAADQYIWAGGGGGAAPQNVSWGRLGKPTDQLKANGASASPNYTFGRKSADIRKSGVRKSAASRKSGVEGDDAPMKSEEIHDYRKRLSMAVRQEANERAEQHAAMCELDALEEEIRAAVAAAEMTSEAAEKALLELEALKQEEVEEDKKYDQEFMQALQLEQAGKLEDDGEFWLRCCARCCRVELHDDETYLGSIERGRGQDAQQKEHFINKSE